MLWNKYWVNTLSSSSLLTVGFYIFQYFDNKLYNSLVLYGLRLKTNTITVFAFYWFRTPITRRLRYLTSQRNWSSLRRTSVAGRSWWVWIPMRRPRTSWRRQHETGMIREVEKGLRSCNDSNKWFSVKCHFIFLSLTQPVTVKSVLHYWLNSAGLRAPWPVQCGYAAPLPCDPINNAACTYHQSQVALLLI